MHAVALGNAMHCVAQRMLLTFLKLIYKLARADELYFHLKYNCDMLVSTIAFLRAILRKEQNITFTFL